MFPEILLEGCKVLNLTGTDIAVGDGILNHERIVLADIVVCSCLLVLVIEALETGVRQVLLVLAPGNPAGVQQVRNGRDIGG